MLWIFLAVISHFFWALVNVGDKYILENKVSNPFVYMAWLVVTNVLFLLLLPFVHIDILSLSQFIVLALVTLSAFLGATFYIKGVSLEEITRVNIWWNLIPLFTLVLAWIFIGERLDFIQIMAFIVLLTGAMIASVHWGRWGYKLSKVFIYILSACFFYALYAVGIRYLSHDVSFLTLFFWFHIIAIFYIPLLLCNAGFRKNWLPLTKKISGKVLLTVIILGILDNIGSWLNFWALSLGPAALVFAMEGWQVIFVFILVISISIFYPKILGEELDKRNTIMKIIAMILMVTGIVIVYLG